MVLALTDGAGVAAVRAHLEATAGQWPPELVARIAQCTVLPLLPQQQVWGMGRSRLASRSALCLLGACWGVFYLFVWVCMCTFIMQLL